MAGNIQLQHWKKICIFILGLQVEIFHYTEAQRITSSTSTTTPYPTQFTSTTEPGFWGLTLGINGIQTTKRPTGSGNVHPPSNSQSGRSTTTTRRSSILLSPQHTTRRSYIVPQFTTTARSHPPEFWFSTTTQRYQQYMAPPPSINFTITDSKNNIYYAKWNGTTNEALLPSANSLRQFTMEFMCNASYPIEWLSQKAFGTKDWLMDEIRHFEPNNKFKIGILLKLTYEKLEFLPNSMDISCSSVTQDGIRPLHSIIKIIKGVNSTLKFHVPRDFVQWPTILGLPRKYAEPRGSNVDCSVRLRWSQQERKFACTVEAPANTTLDFLDNCYDQTSCQRTFTDTERSCSDQERFNQWRNAKTEHKAPEDIWSTENIPSTGIVYCQRGENENHSAAVPFFYSPKKLCPEDNEKTRLRLYVHSQPLALEILETDFISFCASKGTRLHNSTMPYNVYSGDNITISCFASFYHFALGTRIGLSFRNRSPKYIEPLDFKLESMRSAGLTNFTAKVRIDSSEVTGIFCENHVKKSNRNIQKMIQLSVKVPQNITVDYDDSSAGLTSWVYTGAYGLFLRCKARGDPQPTITWHKHGRQISPLITEESSNEGQTETVSVLRFPTLTKNEDVKNLHGTYTCKAENSLDVAERTFTVTSSNTSTTQIVVDASGNRVNGGDNTGLILGIVVPTIVLAVVGVVGFLIWKIKRQNRELKLLSKAEVDEFIFGKPEFLHHHSSSEEVNNYAPFLPYNKGYEIDKEQLEIDATTVLGSGAYAIVLRGTVHRRGDHMRVAVKTAKPMDDVGYFKALLSELKIMGFIGTHSNIVNLVGAYTKNIQNREIFIAIEFCENGNLLTYLRDNRQRYRNYVDKDGEIMTDAVITEDSFVYPGKEGLTTITLIKWAEEIAYGMEFLSSKKVIHGDLAARNILLTEHLVAKIGDFGLSRQLFEYANYIKKQQSPLPWKWLALECLQDMKFSVKSDVWAYSILLFEIFSLGQVPYPGHSYNDEFLDALVGGKRPNKPPSATKETYKLMQSCWEENPQQRPTFTQIRDFFSKILSQFVPQEYMDLHEKVTSTMVIVPPITTNAVVHQGPSSGNELSTDGNGDKKHIRFSFNTKTITALFHR